MYPGVVEKEPSSSFPDSYREVVYEQNNYVANAYLAFDNTWNGHHVTATAGTNYETRLYRDLSALRYDLLSDELSDFNLATGELGSLTGGVSEYALLGFFARATYDWKSRYLIEFNGRYDGSSRFLKGHRWGFFPSVSAGWRLSEEPFMAGAKDVLNNAKLRLSYGSLGNQNIGYYDYYQTISTSQMNYSFDGQSKELQAMVSAPVMVSSRETLTSPVNQETTATAASELSPPFRDRSSTMFLIGLPSRRTCRLAYMISSMVSCGSSGSSRS